MNRRDEVYRSQQAGGYFEDAPRRDTPGQARQWQADSPRQAGGFIERDDYRFPGGASDDSDIRTDWGRDRGHDRERERDAYRDHDAQRAYRRRARHHEDREAHYPIGNFDASSGNTFADFTSEDYGGRDLYVQRGCFGGGMAPSNSYRPSFGPGSWHASSANGYGEWRAYGEKRGFFERAGDEVASWFGDEDAARRRERDHRGRGPSDYTRSDERIREDVNDHLTNDWRVDASHITVRVSSSEVTLDGTVGSRQEKRRAEDIAEDVSGVTHVQNNLRVGPGKRLGDTGSDSVAGSRASSISGT